MGGSPSAMLRPSRAEKRKLSWGAKPMRRADVGGVVGGEGGVAQKHLARCRVVDARDERDEGALAGAGGADDGHRAPGLRREGDAVQDETLGSRVAEGDIPELDRGAALRRGTGGGRRGDRRLDREDAVEARHRGRTALEEVHHPPERDHWPREERQVEREGHEVAHPDSPRHDQATAVPEPRPPSPRPVSSPMMGWKAPDAYARCMLRFRYTWFSASNSAAWALSCP